MRTSVKRLRRTPEEARRLILETAQALIARAGPEGLRLHLERRTGGGAAAAPVADSDEAPAASESRCPVSGAGD